MSTRVPPQEQTEFISQYFDGNDNDFRTSLEIIANLLIELGIHYMDIAFLSQLEDPTDTAKIMESLLQHRKTNGETIANATALQGLNILCWLNSGK